MGRMAQEGLMGRMAQVDLMRRMAQESQADLAVPGDLAGRGDKTDRKGNSLH